MQTVYRSSRALLYEKRTEIIDHLEKFAPTIVISAPEGIHVFAQEIEKVYTTILLAGAGSSFAAIADWFRTQIAQLVMDWGRNIPDAAVEGRRLLPRVFEPNLQLSRDMIYADITVVEIGSDPATDKIFHLDFLKNWDKLDGGKMHCLSMKTMRRFLRQAADQKDESNFIGRETDEKLRQEREKYGIPAAENRLPAAEELQHLIAAYAHDKAFLDRAKYLAKQYDWVYRAP